MGVERVPVDPAAREAYVKRVRTGPCFVCALIAGEPGYGYEQLVFDDGEHVAFLNRYPTVYRVCVGVAEEAHRTCRARSEQR